MTKRALCILVISWNRPEFLKRTLESLARNLHGISADLFVVDNGSDSETTKLIREAKQLSGYLLLHENIGINAAIERALLPSLENRYENIFISDADMNYQLPLVFGVEALRLDREIGAVSYQHSPEHPVTGEKSIAEHPFLLKDSERGCSLMMRTELLETVRPLPVENLKDFDWWVCRDAPGSIQKQQRQIAVLAGGAFHLGWKAGDSTWQASEITEYPEFQEGFTT